MGDSVGHDVGVRPVRRLTWRCCSATHHSTANQKRQRHHYSANQPTGEKSQLGHGWHRNMCGEQLLHAHDVLVRRENGLLDICGQDRF